MIVSVALVDCFVDSLVTGFGFGKQSTSSAADDLVVRGGDTNQLCQLVTYGSSVHRSSSFTKMENKHFHILWSFSISKK